MGHSFKDNAIALTEEHFYGHRNPERHRTLGTHRAWCSCGTYCYPRLEMACYCCAQDMRDRHPCPTCDGNGFIGVNQREEQT